MARQNKLFREYCEKYPDTPNLTLAKKINHDHPHIPVEVARSGIRYYRGSCGEANRARIGAYSETWEPYHLKAGSVIVASDLHIPYQDNVAIDVLFDRIAEVQPDTVLFNGDLLDFYQGSIFSHDPQRPSLREEMDSLSQFFSDFRECFPDVLVVYKLGNHERRWETLIWNKVPELAEFAFANVQEFIAGQVQEYNVEVVGPSTPIVWNKLHIIHGHEYRGGISGPVNPARLMFTKAKKSILCGHFHQASEHIEPAIDGSVLGAWSTGCLCQLHPEYSPLNKWTQGFAELYGEYGQFEVKNRKIIAGKLV